MSLTSFQRRVCRALAARRIASGESYVAGGAALNAALGGSRVSRDVDVFHDTDAALASSVTADVAALRTMGLAVALLRELPAFVEASVSEGPDGVLVQWVRDSAFRFFPLVEDDDLGLTLHPLDLATNKVLALVGRVEVRDWVDVLTCHARLQPLGYLAWATAGKDAGLSPTFVLAEASRTARYTQPELAALAFDGPAPSASELAAAWRDALAEAREIVDALPAEHVGTCVLDSTGALFRGSASDARRAIPKGDLVFHPGAIRGAWPRVLAAR